MKNILIFICLLLFSCCKKEAPVAPKQQQVITQDHNLIGTWVQDSTFAGIIKIDSLPQRIYDTLYISGGSYIEKTWQMDESSLVELPYFTYSWQTDGKDSLFIDYSYISHRYKYHMTGIEIIISNNIGTFYYHKKL